MSEGQRKQDLFEQTVLPHIGAAFNLARWLLNNDQDAEDIVQDSFLRAFKYFDSYQGGSSRSWLLTIVRNSCYTWLHQNRTQAASVELDEEMTTDEQDSGDPELFFQAKINHQMVAGALAKLPVEFRELIILRDLEGMSYKEIALVAGIPIGTVMSRLARARLRLKECLSQSDEEGAHEQ